MASAIASVPVLTGEVAQRFEAQAEQTYREYIERTATKNGKDSRYEQGIQMVRNTLAKAALHDR